MDDEKAVEVICTFVNECMMDPFDATLDFAQGLLAAIRAQGGEVVWWQQLGVAMTIKSADPGTLVYFPEVGQRCTHVAHLRGPEVKP